MNSMEIDRILMKFNHAVEGDEINLTSDRFGVKSNSRVDYLIGIKTKSINSLIDKYIAANTDTCRSVPVRPWNYDDFLTRLKSFHNTSHWFAKDLNIDAISCCRYGWTNTKVDTLTCSYCQSTISHSKFDTE